MQRTKSSQQYSKRKRSHKTIRKIIATSTSQIQHQMTQVDRNIYSLFVQAVEDVSIPLSNSSDDLSRLAFLEQISTTRLGTGHSFFRAMDKLNHVDSTDSLVSLGSSLSSSGDLASLSQDFNFSDAVHKSVERLALNGYASSNSLSSLQSSDSLSELEVKLVAESASNDLHSESQHALVQLFYSFFSTLEEFLHNQEAAIEPEIKFPKFC